VENAGAGGVGVAVKACGLRDYIFPKFSEYTRQFCQIALTIALKAGRPVVGSVDGREEVGRGGAGAAAATEVAGLSSGHASAGADPP